MKSSKLEEKRGISLIALVITIIVMIILAAAIILSLSNSGIIGKANKAKTDSDTANLKEYVNALKAEYELMSDVEKEDKTFVQFANLKLEEKGYERKLAENGALMNENATVAVKEGIQVGDVVGYNQFLIQKSDADKSYTTDGSENTASAGSETASTPRTVKTDETMTWKYIGISEEGNIEISPDIPTGTVSNSYRMTLAGKGGYLNGPTMLDKACSSLYSTTKGNARSMNIDDVNNILGYIGEKGAYYSANGKYTPTQRAKIIGELEIELGTQISNTETPDGRNIKTYESNSYHIDKTSDVNKMTKASNVGMIYYENEYWLASSCVYAYFHNHFATFYVRRVTSSSVTNCGMFDSRNTFGSGSYLLRPVVELNSDVQLIKDTSATNTWKIQ